MFVNTSVDAIFVLKFVDCKENLWLSSIGSLLLASHYPGPLGDLCRVLSHITVLCVLSLTYWHVGINGLFTLSTNAFQEHYFRLKPTHSNQYISFILLYI